MVSLFTNQNRLTCRPIFKIRLLLTRMDNTKNAIISELHQIQLDHWEKLRIKRGKEMPDQVCFCKIQEQMIQFNLQTFCF